MAIRMQQRRGTSEQWTLANPILAEGEIGFETDNNQFKVGDGVNQWSALAYFVNLDGISGTLSDYIELVEKGAANGVATLDATGQVPATQLGNATVDLTGYATESFVNDAIEAIPLLDLTGYATESYVGTVVSNLVASAPEALDTLNELASALGDDANFATTITTSLSGKSDVGHTHGIEDVTDFLITTPAENEVLKYNGTNWINAAASGGGIQASETPPIDTEAFPLWFNTTEGRAYIWYDSFWVELTPSFAGPQGAQGEVGPAGADGFLDPDLAFSNITLESRKRYFVNTGAPRTLTLPASPSIGDEIQLFDQTNLAAINNVTISRNGQKINGQDSNALLDVNAFAAVLIYTGATFGWRLG